MAIIYNWIYLNSSSIDDNIKGKIKRLYERVLFVEQKCKKCVTVLDMMCWLDDDDFVFILWQINTDNYCVTENKRCKI